MQDNYRFAQGINRRIVAVTPKSHLFIKQYAKKHNISIAEATFKLLGIAFSVVIKEESEEYGKHNR